jgi:hypothetical protein
MKRMAILFTTLLIVGCGDDDGTTAPSPATTGTITGTLTLTGDNCPGTDLSISLHENWYPTGAPASSDLEVIINEGAYSYTLSNIPFGTYSAIAVSWDSGVMNDVTHTTEITIGFYGSMGVPTEVTVSSDSPTIENIDFNGDCSILNQ